MELKTSWSSLISKRNTGKCFNKGLLNEAGVMQHIVYLSSDYKGRKVSVCISVTDIAGILEEDNFT